MWLVCREYIAYALKRTFEITRCSTFSSMAHIMDWEGAVMVLTWPSYTPSTSMNINHCPFQGTWLPFRDIQANRNSIKCCVRHSDLFIWHRCCRFHICDHHQNIHVVCKTQLFSNATLENRKNVVALMFSAAEETFQVQCRCHNQ